MYSHICETDFHSIVKLRIMDTKHIGYYKMMRTKESSRKAPGAQTMRLNSFPPDVGVLLLRKYTLLKYKQMQTQVAISNQPPPLTRFCSKSTRPRDVRTMDLSSQWWNATLILRIFFFFIPKCWLCQRSRTNHRQLVRLTRLPMAYSIAFFSEVWWG